MTRLTSGPDRCSRSPLPAFRPILICLSLLPLWLSAGCEVHREKDPPLLVFAAASLTDVLTELRTAYLAEMPDADVRLHLAASSMLARQVRIGAPAGLFFSAHPEWIDSLREAGLLTRTERLPVDNQIVVVRRTGLSAGGPEPWWAAARIALADPTHVPAGRYAAEALQCLGLWKGLSMQVVPALDVRAAVASVESGAAAYGLAYRTDVVENDRVEVHERISGRCQPEVRYEAGVVREGPSGAANAFLDFVMDPDQARYWRAAGFAYDPMSIEPVHTDPAPRPPTHRTP